MSTPRPNFTPSRLNVKPYRVLVEIELGQTEHFTEAQHEDLCRFLDGESYNVKLISFRSLGKLFQRATVHPDGSLMVEPEPWAARHYRRAVMRGAGAYQAGLWVMLAARRAQQESAQVVEGAALNGVRVLARFTGGLPGVKFNELWRVHRVTQHLAYWRISAGTHLRRHEIKPLPLKFSNPNCLRDRYEDFAGWAGLVGREFDRLIYKRYTLSLGHSLSTSLRLRFAEITTVTLWQVHREQSRSVTRQRPPARVPRPIHAHPRPPAAPLAPPAL